jgi:hypothetical protein
MEPLALFERALSQVVSGQNLQEASLYLRQQLKSPANVMVLFERLKITLEAPVRQLIYVLLRRSLVKHWAFLSVDFQEAVKAFLLQAIFTEPQAIVRRNIASTMSSLAGVVDWPELIQQVSAMCLNEASLVREVGLFVLSEMLDNENTYPSLKPYFAGLGQLLVNSLTDPAFEVKKNALLGIGHLVQNIPEELGDIRPLLPLLTNLVSDSAFDEQLVSFAFEIFSKLIPNSDCVLSWVQLALSFACNADLQLTTREGTMDFLETVAEDLPKTFTKNPGLCEQVINAIFQLAVECDDDPSESTPVDMAFRLLDTLALSLPNKYIWRPCIELIQQLQVSPSPRARRAAMIAPGVLAEGCSELLKEDLSSLLEMLVGGLQDPRETVAEGAAIAIGYCAEHLRPDILDWHAEILPPLILALSSESQVVRRRVLFAVDAFVEACDDELIPHLDALLKGVVSIVLTNDKESIKTALGTLNTIIAAAEGRVSPYFYELVGLLERLTRLDVQQHSSLVATALHTLGQLCAKCSVEQFTPYLASSATLALTFIQSTDLELREAGFAFFYLAIPQHRASFSSCMGTVVAQALISVDRQAASAPEDSEDGEEELISNTFLDEKTAAMHTLGFVAVTYPELLPQFADSLLGSLEVLTHDSHESFRLESVLTYTQLMTGCTQGAGMTTLAQTLWTQHVLPKFLEILEFEKSPRVVGRVLENLQELITNLGSTLLVPSGLEEVIPRLAVLIQGTSSCQRAFEDEDERDFQEELMTDLTGVLTAIFKACAGCLQQLEFLLLLMLDEAKPSKPRKSRSLYIGCLAEACACLPPWKPQKLLSMALASLDVKHTTISRNACFLIGVVCAASDNSPSYPQILQALQPFFEIDPKTSSARGLQDNAVAAVARMMTASPQFPLWPQVLGPWFARLPLKEDTDEKPTVLKAIVVLAETVDLSPHLGSLLEVCFDVLLHAVPTQYPPATMLRVKTLMLSLRETAEFQALGGRLSQAEQAVLSQSLS